jgi:hypothetical protein
MTRIFWIPLGLTIALLSAFPFALAEERFWLVTEPSEGMPTCEEFFDKWEVPGAPVGLMAMSGFAREAFAAKKCVDKGDVATACKHWQGLLVVMDKVGPPLSESRGDVENLMREHKCDIAAKSGTNPATQTVPSTQPTPDAQATPAPKTSDTPQVNPDAHQ